MTESVTDRASYRPGPCKVCGARVVVSRWIDDTPLAGQRTWIPIRKCTNTSCESNEGSLASPSA